MEFNLFDSHAHLQAIEFDGDREAVLVEMKEKKIGAIVVGNNLSTSKKAVALAEKQDFLWAAVGLHPGDIEGQEASDGNNEDGFEEFKEENYYSLLENKKVVAVGECGLDYTWVKNDWQRKKQKEVFCSQISLAKKFSKPLILHIRSVKGTLDAHNDALNILEEFGEARGVCHFFSADWPTAKRFLDLGFYCSFAGPITFTKQYDEAVANIPLDKILAETDCPLVAPAPFRGERNEPARVEYVVRRIAEIKGLSFEEAAQATIKNTIKLFNL